MLQQLAAHSSRVRVHDTETAVSPRSCVLLVKAKAQGSRLKVLAGEALRVSDAVREGETDEAKLTLGEGEAETL